MPDTANNAKTLSKLAILAVTAIIAVSLCGCVNFLNPHKRTPSQSGAPAFVARYSNSVEGVDERVELYEFDGTTYKAETAPSKMSFPENSTKISEELVEYLRSDGDDGHVWWDVQPAHDEALQADFNGPKTSERKAHPIEWGITDYYVVGDDYSVHWIGRSGSREMELDDPHVKKFLSLAQ